MEPAVPPDRPADPDRWSPALAVVLVVVLLAGTLFGYDQGVIAGALAGVQHEFRLSPLAVEIVTSWVTLGALAGSLAGGELADRLGRRRALLAAAALFAAGAAIEAFAPAVPVLVTGRLVVGFGVGVAAVAAPLYAAELAPAGMRGRFVATYQLAITGGIFLAYLIDQALAGGDRWRAMLGASAVPAVLLFVAMLVAVESPRWLARVGRRDEARAAIARARPHLDADARLASIEASLRAETGSATWREVFAPAWRRPLVVGIGLAIYQQVTGINAIIYYSDRIFAAAGFASSAAQAQASTWAIGAVNVLATFIAIAFIDRVGRRPLLLAGLVGMGASLAVTGLAFARIAPAGGGAGPTTAGVVTLGALVVFIVCFAFSLGPVVWTVINEIFPGRVRGRAVAVATAVNWGAAFAVSETFLTLVDAIGEPLTFGLFALFCAVGFAWVWREVPETKGRSLEQIQALWAPAAPDGTRASGAPAK
ncbi:MAG: sugar porter family MFS transporter [Burkholderiales bacterium]